MAKIETAEPKRDWVNEAYESFVKDAKDIDRKQACAIAACLPAPLERTPDNTSGFLGRRQRQIHSLIPKLTYPEWAQ